MDCFEPQQQGHFPQLTAGLFHSDLYPFLLFYERGRVENEK